MYIIIKSSRFDFTKDYRAKDAYRGHSCDVARVEPGKVYETEEEAILDAHAMSNNNPVGFVVVRIKND